MGVLDGKVAVVTGGGSGMGEAIARLFVAEGARVAILDIDEEQAKTVAESLGAACVSFSADVSRSSDVERALEDTVERFGRLDAMVNNAGISPTEGLIPDCPEDLFDRNLAVNLKGVWLGMKHAIPHLVAAGGGSILSTASVGGMIPVVGLAAYGAAKSAVIHLTRVCALENARHRIRANCLCPGGIVTPMLLGSSDIFQVEDSREQVEAFCAEVHPLGRAGQPEEVAQAALYLTSDAASFVTGQALAVDGGIALNPPRPQI